MTTNMIIAIAVHIKIVFDTKYFARLLIFSGKPYSKFIY